MVYSYEKSKALFERAKKVLPGGIYGHYAEPAKYSGYPLYFSRAGGSRFTDLDGNEFIDYICGYGSILLGYNHPAVDEAARRQYASGNCTSLNPPIMVELAEKLVDMIPPADWAFFAKNGADVTNLSVLVARAATGREKIVMVKGGYHGASPWMQQPGRAGTIDDDFLHVLTVDWNDYSQFERTVAEHDGDIAAFISSPYHHPTFADNELPAEGYWQQIEGLCKKKGIVLICDDVRAGFRIDLRGSQEYFRFKPDLICFGKALGNGYPISALLGSSSLFDAASAVFCTGTTFFSAAPMAAALAALSEMEKIDAPAIVDEKGKKLAKGMTEIAALRGYDLKVTGMPSMPYIRIANRPSGRLSKSWASECARRGVFFLHYHNNFISTAHSDEDIDRSLEIMDEALKWVR